ncbi:hypothetical protein NEPAR06_0520 [Nematocida parisii]|uniref:Uncharacterized protein n=1 Tax=Nematocida parisii (strain ERTm3) TaxID=935791 RepID=I3EJD2_NEMP3|nr:uncharacterized protein NEPG_01138 [Nematocida parisii ERTm1]EIJ89329.1 hypothetical protein NEQG_00099 [Nematocida parisii ERTm3]KAI5142562.1 hypothetical protein NEPAR07_0167 [Nematocida parisii]EIJ94470.1 hypothetical protein NEPG_01138 [Nematocida parisii ERTm1]KAI5153520.1 hypothetical protein NEPAR06_0520 [Nematocida parisii]KAI5156943.1 hypothetical protein NEPAR05_0926 [Nematocida parisii]|eukprot:XP_013058966.1 hypothetical protein NEPG_01138 [Nematocida parisii ERTm1]
MNSWIKSMVTEVQEHIGCNWVKIGRDIMQTDTTTQAVLSQQERLSDDPYGINRVKVGVARAKYNPYVFKIECVIGPKKDKCHIIRISDNLNTITAYVSNDALRFLKKEENIAVDISSLLNMHCKLLKGYFIVNTSSDRKVSLYIERMSYAGDMSHKNKKVNSIVCRDVNVEKEVELISKRIENEINIYKESCNLPNIENQLENFDFLNNRNFINLCLMGDSIQNSAHSQVYLGDNPTISVKTIKHGIEEYNSDTEDQIDSSNSSDEAMAESEIKENSTESSDFFHKQPHIVKEKGHSPIKYVASTIPIKKHFSSMVKPEIKPITSSITHNKLIPEIIRVNTNNSPSKPDSRNLTPSITNTQKIRKREELNEILCNKKGLRLRMPPKKRPSYNDSYTSNDTLNSVEIPPSVIKSIISTTSESEAHSENTEQDEIIGKCTAEKDQEWSSVEELSETQVDEMINETISRFPTIISISEYKKRQNNQ